MCKRTCERCCWPPHTHIFLCKGARPGAGPPQAGCGATRLCNLPSLRLLGIHPTPRPSLPPAACRRPAHRSLLPPPPPPSLPPAACPRPLQRRKKQFSLLFYVLEELQRTNDNTAEELAAIELLPPQPSAAAPTAAAGGQATAMDVDE